MINYFPKRISNTAIAIYFLALLVVPVLNFDYAMQLQWMIFGILSVVCFFYFSNKLSKSWINLSEPAFINKIFYSAIIIRVVYVIGSYFFFIYMNEEPFEFAAGDSKGYHYEGEWIVDLIDAGQIELYFAYIQEKNGVSDIGYPLFLGIQYLVTYKSIIIARLIKAILGAYTCVLVYKLAKRNFGDVVARLSAIFVLLMPNLIMYTGMHLKETEMTFLVLAFLERADYLLRSKRYSAKSIIILMLLIASLFLFRTVLGIAAIFSVTTAVVFSKDSIIKRNRRLVVGIWMVIAVVAFTKSSVSMEIERLWNNKSTNQVNRLENRSKKGNVFAKYAGAAVFAPLIFTLPFPTMIETPNQETFRMLHGGVYVKNILSFFTIITILGIFIKKRWRENVFILTFILAYLIILALSAFAHSERFHLPAIPIEMIFAAVGISQLNEKNMSRFNTWSLFIFVAVIAWSWFKLKGRGVI
jgi:hypothetical protein